ncbi:Site-specific DNA methylase protein [Halorhabdus tiamatea SARL4B]|uniref:Site-specific DNA methylase protein n=1 Tax=Halorhabdus tiamatea SARL4B TaxID=1033806 RepID=F7PMP9_9EURY|nr:DNA cytosine methyltransferase [Halorhabdus tiamatea]ERJ07458.1 Site-specific DNA methylase protein [Halorhabdus tiamatea SARL4B]
MAVAIDDCGRTHTDAQSLRERILADYDDHQVPLAIDLFCGVGGVARTLHSYGHRGPGWETLGIDVDGSKADTYPGHFLEWDLEEGLPEIVDELVAAGIVDVIWASPPCQFATNVQFRRDGKNLIPVARDLLSSIAAPVKIIENVTGAEEHLENPVKFCGGAFGLGVQKHRLFETNFFAHGTDCEHPSGGFEYCIGDREAPVESYRAAHGFRPDVGLTTKEVREAIPPAYVEELLRQHAKYGRVSVSPATDQAKRPGTRGVISEVGGSP